MNQTEFDQVFRAYYPSLCCYAESILGDLMVGEDLVEEVFIKVWERRKKGKEIEQIRPYLYKATRNACLDYLRKMTPVINISNDLENLPEEPDHTDLEMLRVELYRQLLAALEQLPQRRGQIVKMAYMEGLPSKTIAGQMGITVSTVDNQKARGLMQLRKLLSKSAFHFFFCF